MLICLKERLRALFGEELIWRGVILFGSDQGHYEIQFKSCFLSLLSGSSSSVDQRAMNTALA
jgi:hypothetical protein